MEDCTVPSHSVEVDQSPTISPNTMQVFSSAADHRAPRAAVIVQDRAAFSNCDDIGGVPAPDITQVRSGAAGHTAPVAAVVVQYGACIAHGEDIGGGIAPHAVEVF